MDIKVQVQKISVKRGHNTRGDWVNTQIIGADGSKWSSFHEGLADSNKGDVIIVEEFDQEDGKPNKITKYHKVEGGSAPAPGTPAGATQQQQVPYGAVTDKDKAERSSIEAQTAFKGIVELACTGIRGMQGDPEIVALADKVGKALDLALDWAEKKLQANMGQAVKDAAKPVKETSKSTTEAATTGHFENAGQFAAAVHDKLGMSNDAVCKAMGVNAVKDIEDLDKAWEALSRNK